MGFLNNILGKRQSTPPRYEWADVSHVNLESTRLEYLEETRNGIAEAMLKIQAINDVDKTGNRIQEKLKFVLGESFLSEPNKAIEQAATMLKYHLADLEEQYKNILKSAGVEEESAVAFLEKDKAQITAVNKTISWKSVGTIEHGSQR